MIEHVIKLGSPILVLMPLCCRTQLGRNIPELFSSKYKFCTLVIIKSTHDLYVISMITAHIHELCIESYALQVPSIKSFG